MKSSKMARNLGFVSVMILGLTACNQSRDLADNEKFTLNCVGTELSNDNEASWQQMPPSFKFTAHIDMAGKKFCFYNENDAEKGCPAIRRFGQQSSHFDATNLFLEDGDSAKSDQGILKIGRADNAFYLKASVGSMRGTCTKGAFTEFPKSK